MAKVLKSISRVDASKAPLLFSSGQMRMWPTDYLPASGIAHFLKSTGVEFKDVIDTRIEMRDERVIQRDFSADYSVWLRETLRDFLRRHTGTAVGRKIRRFSNRERLTSLEDICAIWGLLDPAAVPNTLQIPVPKGTTVEGSSNYAFTPYSILQENSVLPVRECASPNHIVKFSTFPELRNCLYTDFDSCSPLRAWSMMSGDHLVLSSEFITTLAMYLNRRIEAIDEDAIASIDPSGTKTFRPILSTFSNGRLAWMLNESGLLPCPVIPTALPRPLIQRRLKAHVDAELISPSFSHQFPVELIGINDALEKHRPSIVLVEPHSDRDYISELRGYFTVREVMLFGQVDSPAMASFSFPLLSFGVTPGPSTYLVYNDSMRKATSYREGSAMPMDPPHEAQGYNRVFVDDISKTMVCSNDCAQFQNQSRCLSFRRLVKPALK